MATTPVFVMFLKKTIARESLWNYNISDGILNSGRKQFQKVDHSM